MSRCLLSPICFPSFLAHSILPYRSVSLVLSGMEDNGIYSKPVDVLVKEKAKFAGRPVRAEGNLVHGTLIKWKDEKPDDYRQIEHDVHAARAVHQLHFRVTEHRCAPSPVRADGFVPTANGVQAAAFSGTDIDQPLDDSSPRFFGQTDNVLAGPFP